jgi:hypothetical protein
LRSQLSSFIETPPFRQGKGDATPPYLIRLPPPKISLSEWQASKHRRKRPPQSTFARAGNYPASVNAFWQSIVTSHGGDVYDCFFLAMAYWKMDDKDKAKKWYDKGDFIMPRFDPNNEELLRFRAEADEVTGLAKAKSDKPRIEVQPIRLVEPVRVYQDEQKRGR